MAQHACGVFDAMGNLADMLVGEVKGYFGEG